MQQFLGRAAAVLETLGRRRGFPAGRRRPHRVYDATIRATLYQCLLRLRRLLNGTSSSQLPPALADALVPQIQVWKENERPLGVYVSLGGGGNARFETLAPTYPKTKDRPTVSFLLRNKTKKRETQKKSAVPLPGSVRACNDRKYLYLPYTTLRESAHDISLFAREITSRA